MPVKKVLPSLNALYIKLNEKYFNNKLPKNVVCEWSSKMSRSAGICYHKRKVIRLSIDYHMRNPEEIEPTLLHEMIHLIAHGHGKDFKQELKRIQALGGVVKRYAKEPAKKPRWHYKCSNRNCTNDFKRYRRIPSHHVCACCKSKLIEKRI